MAGYSKYIGHGKLASPAAVVPHFSFSGDRHAREALSLVAELFASSHGTCSVQAHERGEAKCLPA